MNKYSSFLALLMLASGWASAIELEPGLWEVRVESKMSMVPAPQIKTVEQCLEKSTVTPADFTKEAGDCQFRDVKDSKTAMSYSMSCPSQQGALTGTAKFISEGSTANGEMQMSMNFRGQTVSMQNSWSGKRIGACPPLP